MNNLEIIESYLDNEEIVGLCRELDNHSNNIENKNYSVGYNNILAKYDLSLDDSTRVEFEVNKLLKTYYLNEKIIKAAFIKSHFSKSLDNILAIEFPVKNSRVDLAKFNGSSYAYEIKTDYDNFSRLQKQLDDYNQIFDYVYIILSKKNFLKNKWKLNAGLGIYSYSLDGSTIKFRKEITAAKNKKKDIYSLLSLLHIRELKFAFKKCPINVRKKEIIETIMVVYNEKYINSKVKSLIKMRYRQKWNNAFYNILNAPEIELEKLYKKNGSHY